MTIKNDLQLLKTYLHEIYQNKIKQVWQDDEVKIKVEFVCLLDGLQKDNDISEKTSNNAYLYENKKHQLILTCLSYKIKIA
jgi:hypothetical protein